MSLTLADLDTIETVLDGGRAIRGVTFTVPATGTVHQISSAFIALPSDAGHPSVLVGPDLLAELLALARANLSSGSPP